MSSAMPWVSWRPCGPFANSPQNVPMIELTACPPSAGSASTSATRRLRRAASSAAETPAMPAPSTQMSAASRRGVEPAGRRTIRVAVEMLCTLMVGGSVAGVQNSDDLPDREPMSSSDAQPLTIAVDDARSVSGLLLAPPRARACYILAHGAGAGMAHPFMAAVAAGLAERAIATLRYQFPYMEQGGRRPDPPKLAQATVRAAAAEAARLLPGLSMIAGGKSFGGRMTSQAQAASPLPGVRGLAFLGFPLHPAGRPSVARADHLLDVQIPMLFLQGSRDQLADLALLRPLME